MTTKTTKQVKKATSTKAVSGTTKAAPQANTKKTAKKAPASKAPPQREPAAQLGTHRRSLRRWASMGYRWRRRRTLQSLLGGSGGDRETGEGQGQ
jgi:hypothetical protein